MKKYQIPSSVLNAASDCPHDFVCLDTGECGVQGVCEEDHASFAENILYLKNIEPASTCLYHTSSDDLKMCSCPVKFYLHQKRIYGDIIFKKCGKCQETWRNYYDFLSDPSLTLRGYQVAAESLETGMFLFNHSCKTTLSIPAGDFALLHDGPILQERATGPDECPEYCLKKHNSNQCPAKCECAYVTEVLLIIKNWPKK